MKVLHINHKKDSPSDTNTTSAIRRNVIRDHARLVNGTLHKF